MSVKGSLSLWRPFALMIVGMTVGAVLVALYGPQSIRSGVSLLDFMFITLFAFVITAYGYRALFSRWTFWLAFAAFFIAHCIVYAYMLQETGPWKMTTVAAAAVVEMAILVMLFTLIFHVSPQSGPEDHD